MKRRWQRGLHLLTGIGRTTKNLLLSLLGKLLPRKRSSIATLFAKLKSGMGLEHSRHRSPRHALVHLPSCLAAYSLAPTKGNISTVHIPGLTLSTTGVTVTSSSFPAPYGHPGNLQSAFTEDSHSSLTARLLKSQDWARKGFPRFPYFSRFPEVAIGKIRPGEGLPRPASFSIQLLTTFQRREEKVSLKEWSIGVEGEESSCSASMESCQG